jgi:hypothetical protein
MAQFSADLNPKQTGMSLGDIMKAGMYGAEMDVLNRQAQVAREKEKELPIIQNWAKDQSNKLPDGSFDLKQLPSLMAMAPMTGPEFAKNITDLTKNHYETNRTMNQLSNENRQNFASIYGNYGQMAAQGRPVTANEVISSFERLKEFNPQLAAAADGHIRGLRAFGNQPLPAQELLKYRNESLSPRELIDQFAPKATMQEIGGQKVQITTTPSLMGEQPSVSASPLAGASSVQPTGEMAPKTETKLPKLIQEDTSLNYTPLQSGIRNLDKFQEAAYAEGDKKVINANASLPAQKDLQQAVRKVEDFISSASGSKVFQMVRQGEKYVFGNADLDALVKNLAQVQARNAAVMGLDKTDSSRELNAKLSGSENIDEKALAGVMQQVKAESKAAEMFTQGINKFVEKRGDVNGKIQAQKFQNAWADNYDPRIFQIDDLAQSKLPENEKQAKIDQITGKMTKDEFDSYRKKSVIIHRLAKGLYQ